MGDDRRLEPVVDRERQMPFPLWLAGVALASIDEKTIGKNLEAQTAKPYVAMLPQFVGEFRFQHDAPNQSLEFLLLQVPEPNRKARAPGRTARK